MVRKSSSKGGGYRRGFGASFVAGCRSEQLCIGGGARFLSAFAAGSNGLGQRVGQVCGSGRVDDLGSRPLDVAAVLRAALGCHFAAGGAPGAPALGSTGDGSGKPGRGGTSYCLLAATRVLT